MATGRNRMLVPWLALSTLAVGCAQSGPLMSRQTMNGTLKATVSQLEFENQKLRKEVGELKAETSRLDNLIVQERDANGELSARLDDAKDLLRRQGGDAQALGIRSKNFEDDEIPPPAANPPARRTRSSRKPPAAQIPRAEPAPFGSSGDDRGFDSSSNWRGRDLGPDDRRLDDDRWLPVARGIGSPVRQ